MKRLCILIFLFCSASALGQAASAQLSEQQITAVADSKAWLRLMHYFPSFRGYTSQLDGRDFFFAPDGKTNPQAEIRASLKAFNQDIKVGHWKIHPQCSFPARFKFLKDTFKLDYKIESCPKYEEFLNAFHGATGVSLVYSSAYPNNPASMFGHTFLKIHSNRGNALLDAGLNFAAFTPANANFAEFMYRGVFGGYRGVWSLEPYFKKVNEYINSESRDLWEYELNLTPEETKMLIAHFWELDVNSYFDYYFFDENCSFQILAAIEAVKLDWKVSHQRIFVIPGESVKPLTDTPGAVRGVNFRPSLYHQLFRRYFSLDHEGRRQVRELSEGKNLEKVTYSPEVLDGALLTMLYRRAKKKDNWSAADQDLENKLLALRAKQPVEAKAIPETPAEKRTRPDLGHDAYSANFTAGYLETKRGAGPMGRYKMRSAYHDLMSSDRGFSSFSEIEFPWIEFQFHKDQFRLQEIGLISTTSLFPLTFVDKRVSWRMKWAAETERGSECQECVIPYFEGAMGAALGEDSYRLYVLALGHADAHPHLNRGYRLRPGIEAGAIVNPFDSRYKAKLVGRSLWNTGPGEQERNYDLQFEHSFALSRNQEIRQATILNYSDQLREAAWIEARVQWIQYFR